MADIGTKDTGICIRAVQKISFWIVFFKETSFVSCIITITLCNIYSALHSKIVIQNFYHHWDTPRSGAQVLISPLLRRVSLAMFVISAWTRSTCLHCLSDFCYVWHISMVPMHWLPFSFKCISGHWFSSPSHNMAQHFVTQEYLMSQAVTFYEDHVQNLVTHFDKYLKGRTHYV